MKKKPALQKAAKSARAKPGDLASLIAEVRTLIQSARRGVASVVDTFQVTTNFEIGRRIVEHEQKGAKRAAYGRELLKALSDRLTTEFGKGFSVSNLQLMRLYFIEFSFRIQQTPSAELAMEQIQQTPSVKLERSGSQSDKGGEAFGGKMSDGVSRIEEPFHPQLVALRPPAHDQRPR